MNTGPQLIRPVEKPERNWLPVTIAVCAVLVIAGLFVLAVQRHSSGSTPNVSSINAPTDPYAAHLIITNLAMSESSNLAGGKVTYLDGHIANTGGRTVTDISVQVLFRNMAHEVAQNETQQLKLIRTREPYVDVEPISADPIRPGQGRDFRLIFDTVTADWDGAYPEIRTLKVETE